MDIFHFSVLHILSIFYNLHRFLLFCDFSYSRVLSSPPLLLVLLIFFSDTFYFVIDFIFVLSGFFIPFMMWMPLMIFSVEYLAIFLIFIYLFIYLFIWLPWVLVVACGIFSCGIQDLVAWPNLGPLHWEHRLLTTGPPRKSRTLQFNLHLWDDFDFFFYSFPDFC